MSKDDVVIKVNRDQIVGFEHIDGTPLTSQEIKHLRYMLDRDLPKPCYVYIGVHEQNSNYVKIGISHAPYKRADTLGLIITRLVIFPERRLASNFEKRLLELRPIITRDKFINTLKNPSEWFRKNDSSQSYDEILRLSPGNKGEEQSVREKPTRGKYIRS